MNQIKSRLFSHLKTLLFFAAFVPLVWLVWMLISNGLGFNPQERINRFFGQWSLIFLLCALAVTPIREITGWAYLAQIRRMTGLFAFFYTSLHFGSYAILDQTLVWADIWNDIIKRPYITLGMSAFLILCILAATSLQRLIKLLGARKWRALHRLVYVAGILSCCHFIMMTKGFQIEPLIYTTVLVFLLGYRFLFWSIKKL